ncbi:ankyrin repeat-containing domain protein, partial [Phaeosphaeriaceae sp. PMI808]
LDLKEILKFHCPNINSADANGRTPLLWAAWRGDDQIVELLMKYGANINTSDHEGFTPLAKAAQAGHLHVVRILLMANASIHSRTLWGYEPIHLASNNKINGHKIVAELLAWDANPNAFSHGSGTPLHNAANRGSIETIKTLLAHAADINALGENGDTPTMVALY